MSSPEADQWGRVDADGTVFVRTSDGEREVGQWPGGDPAEALALYTRRFEGLATEVGLLERRIRSGAVPADEATKAVGKIRTSLDGAQAVGDLDSLSRRLDALAPLLESRREEQKAAKAEKLAEARAAKEAVAARAEKLAENNDWRNGADALRAMLEEWKALPRLDRPTDDALWRRFSSARTTYTRRRKAHFAQQHEERGQAQAVKEKLVAEAEALSGSTDWGPTSGEYRDLMQKWKAAGPAPRGVEDRLWKRFRSAQDVFFGARDESNRALDVEYEANAEVKRALLLEAEALLPVTDLDAARARMRDIGERWEAAGKVPRADVRPLDQRLRAVEDAITAAQDDRWTRTNPEARQRAADAVAQLEKAIADLTTRLEKAQAAGDAKRESEARAGIEARESWLVEARKALTDFS